MAMRLIFAAAAVAPHVFVIAVRHGEYDCYYDHKRNTERGRQGRQIGQRRDDEDYGNNKLVL